RRFIPGLGGIDLSTLILAWLLESVIVISVYLVQGYDFESNIIAAMGVMGLLGIIEIIKTTLYIILVTIILQAILSWVNPHSPMTPLLDNFTRPFLDIFRKRIPPIANVDLSPLFVLIIIQLLLMVVTGVNSEITAILR
ncbi:MAG: YggT family protein, partial [Nitrosomonas sp.]